MHAVLFTPAFFPKIGGAQTAVDAIARGLLGAGHHVTVLAQIPSHPQPLPFPADLPYETVRFARPISRGIGVSVVARHLSRIHRRKPIDAVQAHFLYYPGWVALNWCRRRRVPLAVMAHGDDLQSAGRYQRRPLTFGRLKAVLVQAPALIAISRSVEKRMIALAPEAAGRIHIIPQTLPQGWGEKSAAVPGLPARYCLYLGRIVKGKGVDLLIRAWDASGLARQDLHLVIAGGGRDAGEFEGYVHEQARAVAGVHFTGDLSPAQSVTALRGASFAVFPSQLHETFGLALLEALTCGVPVLAHAGEAYKEVLDGCAAARITDCADADAFSAALRGMHEHPPATAGLREWLKRYSAATVSAMHAELLKRATWAGKA